MCLTGCTRSEVREDTTALDRNDGPTDDVCLGQGTRFQTDATAGEGEREREGPLPQEGKRRSTRLEPRIVLLILSIFWFLQARAEVQFLHLLDRDGHVLLDPSHSHWALHLLFFGARICR